MNSRVYWVLHELNPWGGHERSNLEILKALTKQKKSVGVLSLKCEALGPELERAPKIKIPFLALKPAILSNLYFLFLGSFRIFWSRRRDRDTRFLSVGACVGNADWVQVQFVNQAWKKIQKTLDPQKFQLPYSRQGGLKATLRAGYQWILQMVNSFLEVLIYRSLGRSKKFIAISRSVENELKEVLGVRASIQVIYHGVDAQVFSPAVSEDQKTLRTKMRAQWGIQDRQKVGLFVGEYERKGLAVVLEAISKLDEKVRNSFHFVAVGGGDQVGFRQLAQSLGVNSQTHLEGHRKNILDYYRAADFFVLPTFYEPFGLVILEALACRLPSIVSRGAGAAELMTHAKNGYLLSDPRSAQELSELITLLLKDETQFEKMGQAARALAESQSWEKVAKQYSEVIWGKTP